MTQLTILPVPQPDAVPALKSVRRRVTIRRTREEHEQIRAFLVAWCAAGKRLWSDEQMAEVINRVVPYRVTGSHVHDARLRSNLQLARNRATGEDHAVLTAALGKAGPSGGAPDVDLEGADAPTVWRAYEAARAALDARYIPLLKRALGMQVQ